MGALLNRRRYMGGSDIDYSKKYLTLIPLQDATFKNSVNAMDYSVNNGVNWTTLAGNTNSPTITAGTKVLLKATITPSSSNGVGTITMTKNFKACGNPLSLLFGDNFDGITDLTGYDYALYYLFFRSSYLVDAKNIALVATVLSQSCYYGMFRQTNIIIPPKLPATTLANSCYNSMFYYCQKLIEMPELPAVTLTVSCYSGMFQGCSSLTKVYDLPALDVQGGSYSGMFNGCSALVTPPRIYATSMKNSNCFNGMFSGCKSLATAPELLCSSLGPNCYKGMFSNCTSLTEAPKLIATTLTIGCYSSMFQGCTSLTRAPELPALTLLYNSYGNMFKGCSSLNYIKAMFTSTPNTSSNTTNWVDGVAATGTFVKNSAATWNETGVNGVPSGWTVETASS